MPSADIEPAALQSLVLRSKPKKATSPMLPSWLESSAIYCLATLPWRTATVAIQ